MLQRKNRIFWLYALIIAALGLYAWRLQVQKERQVAAYEQQYRTLIAAHNHLEQAITYRLSQIHAYCDAYRISEFEVLRMQGKYVAKAAEALSQFSREEINRSIIFDPDIQGMLPQVRRSILPDSATTAFFKQENDFADSLRLFSRKYEKELVALELLFSKERRAAAESIIAGSRPDQKALFLALARVGHAAAANCSLAFLHSRMPEKKHFSIPIMPVPVFEGTCHRAGETIRGEVGACIYPAHTENVTYWVNGKPLPQVSGPGKYSAIFRHTGAQEISIQADVHNPLTGETKPYSKTTIIQVCD